MLMKPKIWRRLSSLNDTFYRFYADSLPRLGFGSVIISKSQDIFTNLALEDWLYQNHFITDGQKKCHLLLLWYNRPAVVLGRHQNPWTEVHINECLSNEVDVVRRNSGGGCVYHDQGNLNISFMSTKEAYNRKSNLNFLRKVLKKSLNIDTEISTREDLILNDGGFKISGTASKLGTKNAYHHCTLMVNVNQDNLNRYLKFKDVSIGYMLLRELNLIHINYRRALAAMLQKVFGLRSKT